MRYMMIMQVDPSVAPPLESIDMSQMLATMGAYNDELQKAGVFLSAEGLTEAGEGFRVDFTSAPPTVTDGPYAESREVFNGYWILEVADRAEVQYWAMKCPLGPGAGLEVRRIHELADVVAIATAAAAELLAKEQEWRAANG